MKTYRFFRMLFRTLFTAVFRWQVIGSQHIPKEGAVILCCNHISNWDPPLLGAGIERQVHFMAKDTLFKIPILSYFIKKFGAYPVKRGAGDKAAIRTTLEILKAGKVIGIFPEGTRSRTGELGPGMNGASLFALKSDAVVIPVAIIGPIKLFRPVKVVYGKPIDLSALKAEKTGAETLRKATELIMSHIQDLLESHRP